MDRSHNRCRYAANTQGLVPSWGISGPGSTIRFGSRWQDRGFNPATLRVEQYAHVLQQISGIHIDGAENYTPGLKRLHINTPGSRYRPQIHTMTHFTPSDFFKNAWMWGWNSREGLGESVRRICHELLTRVQDPRYASANHHQSK